MRTLTDPAEVRSLIAQAKVEGQPFLTNFFLAAPALEHAVSHGNIQLANHQGSLILLHREPLFHRIYFAATLPNSLVEPLSRLELPPSANLIADLIGPPAALSPWAEAFRQSGFATYTKFHRMQRIATTEAPQQQAIIARETEAEEILNAITENFDPYAERIPPLEEVRAAAAAGTILVSRVEQDLAALLYYEKQGVTTHLRYWLGLPAYRGTGHAHALMQSYFYEARACRRFILWVEQTNRRAIPLYERYGYSRDTVEDLILRKPALQKA